MSFFDSSITSKLIRELNISRNNILETINLNVDQESLLYSKKERLEISKFIKDYFGENIEDVFTQQELEKLCDKLEEIETDLSLKIIDSKNSKYEEQKRAIDRKIEIEIKNINNLISQRGKLLYDNKESSLLEELYVKIILNAKNIVEEYNQKDISSEKKVSELQRKIGNLNIQDKQKEYLDNIIMESQKYLPSFAEFKFIDSFDPKELAVKIKESPLSKPFYASEAGSGANWVAYHIAMLLGFHKHFIDKNTAVFNFLIFDQPSQVYFPKSVYDEKHEIQIFGKDTEDALAVKEMFEVMQKSIKANEGKLQILVLDHAGKDIWENIEDIHEVDEWINEKALIPQNWIVNP